MEIKNRAEKINQLVEQYGKQVYLSALRVVGDPDQAEDIAQNVFLKLLKLTPKQFNNVNAWRGYLIKLAATSSIDLIRQLKREKGSSQHHQSVNIDEEAHDLASPNHSPLAQLDISRDLHQVRIALSQLSPQESEVIILRLIENFSYQEVADQLEITASLVGVTLHRAHKKLLGILNESNFLGENYD